MTARPLDQRIKRYYNEHSLDDNKLAQLAAQAALVEDGRTSTQHRWRFVAAVATVTLGLSVWWAGQSFFYGHGTWSTRAAQEIALNHKKQLREEFVAADFDSLRSQMGKLDFVLTEPPRLASLGLRIIGARYCSIQGHLAAQIKLSDAQGRRYTLYETHLADQVNAEFEQSSMIEGIEIWQWRDGELFFGLATSAE